MFNDVEFELTIYTNMGVTEDVYDEVIKRLQEEKASNMVHGCFAYDGYSPNVICSYDDMFCIIKKDDGTLIAYDDTFVSGYEVEEVCCLEYPKHIDMSEDELLSYCEDTYDYSGELDDCSAYCYWVRV